MGADLIGILAAILIFVIGYAIAERIRLARLHKKVRARVDQLTDFADTTEIEVSIFNDAEFRANAKGFAGFKYRLNDQLAPIGGLGSLRTVALMAITGFAVTVLVLQKFLGMSPIVAFLLALLPSLILPVMHIRGMTEKRRLAFLDAFPDAIDLVVRAIRAGIPTSESIAAAGRELPQPLGGEFSRIAKEVAIGVNVDRALHDAAHRIRLADFNFFAVTLLLQRETGGNLAETLENLSMLLRKRREMRLKIRALTAEGRFTSKVIAGLPVLVMIALYFLNREYVELLFTDSLGQIFLAGATILVVSGSVILSRMVNLEV